MLPPASTSSDMPRLDDTRSPWSPVTVARYSLIAGDGIAFMAARRARSIEAIVTDPPYGLREYQPAEQKKLRGGRGGVWRIPPALGGHTRSPLPRFTVLTDADRARLGE